MAELHIFPIHASIFSKNKYVLHTQFKIIKGKDKLPSHFLTSAVSQYCNMKIQFQ